jgi:filamentous hemagglutinin family protein
MRPFFLVLALPLTLWANPESLSVHSGQAEATCQGNLLEVVASDRAILNWESFSIASHEITRFIQPSANSAVLNRVTGTTISELMGALEANGKVYLVNPNGIVIGPEGQINAAAFLATTAEIKLDDFFKGNEFLLSEEANGKIINLGTIETATGPVVLFAHRIENAGTITAPDSTVSIISGRELLIDPTGDSLIFIRHPLDGGGIDQQGVINALEVKLQSDGPFDLAISCGGLIDASSIVQEGGRIFIQAEGTIDVSGATLDASGTSGGSISLFGTEITGEKSEMRADGKSEGGSIRIGGDYQGKTKDGFNSNQTKLDSSVSIFANSSEGKGGKVILWSDGDTEFHGNISAQGFLEGGFAEVSGLKSLFVTGPVDLRSEIGQAGTLLLDPGSVVITTGAATGPDTFGDAYIQAQLELGNVTINTADATAGPLTITVDIGVIISPTLGTSKLTLIAGDSITFSGLGGVPVTITNTPLDMQAVTFINMGKESVFSFGNSATPSTWTAGTDIYVDTSGFGSVYTDISWSGASTFTMSAGGTIALTGDTTTSASIASSYSLGSFDAIDFTALGTVSGNYSGISLNRVFMSSDAGNIILTGTGGDTGSNCNGIYINDSPFNISTTGLGNITMTGHGRGGAASNDNVGVLISSYVTRVETTGTGDINITGESSGTAGVNGNIGIFINGAIAVGNATVTFDGTGGGSGTGNDGIYIFSDGVHVDSGSVTSATGTSLTGSAPSGQGSGIHIDGGIVDSVDGNIGFNGSTASSSNYAILIETTGSLVQTTGTGTISLDTTAGDVLIGYVATDTNPATVETTGTGAISFSSANNIIVNGGTTNNAYIRNTNAMSSVSIQLTADRSISFQTSGAGNPIASLAGSGDITLITTGVVSDSYSGAVLAAGSLTVNSGTLSITGVGGVGDPNYGVFDTGSTLTPSGTGAISLTGTGGSGGSSCYGVYLFGAPTITTSSGTIDIIGTGGAAGGPGIFIDTTSISTGGNTTLNGTGPADTGITLNPGTSIAATGTATVDLIGNGTTNDIYVIGGTVSTVNGDLTLTGTSFQITLEQATVVIETTGSGNIIMNPQSNLNLGTGGIDTGPLTIRTTGTGNISLNSFEPMSGGGAFSSASSVNQASVTTVSGDITIIAGTQIFFSNGILSAGGSGAISLTTYGNLLVPNNVGIFILQSNFSTVNGTLTMIGTGNAADFCSGVKIDGSTITSTGSGNIVIQGTGGPDVATTQNYGVHFLNAASISSTTGSISITGNGGADSLDQGYGVLFESATVNSGTTLSVTGTAYGAGTNADGIVMNTGASLTASTSIGLNGTSTTGGGTGIGIHIYDATVSSSNAPITFTGASSTSYGILLEAAGSLVQTSGSGAISLNTTAGDILIGYNGSDSGTATVQTTGTGSLSFNSFGNTNITGGTANSAFVQITNAASPANMTLISGLSLFLSTAGAGVPTILNAGTGTTYLVVDNQFPSSPGIGTGGISLGANASLTNTNPASEMRLYTSEATNNTFNAPINGVIFVSTDPQQVLGTYYPSGSYIGPGYTLYYKTPAPAPPEPPAPPAPPTPIPVVIQTTVVATNEASLNPPEIALISLNSVQTNISTPDPQSTCRVPSVSVQVR